MLPESFLNDILLIRGAAGVIFSARLWAMGPGLRARQFQAPDAILKYNRSHSTEGFSGAGEK
jgi:hypothetical protein